MPPVRVCQIYDCHFDLTSVAPLHVRLGFFSLSAQRAHMQAFLSVCLHLDFPMQDKYGTPFLCFVCICCKAWGCIKGSSGTWQGVAKPKGSTRGTERITPWLHSHSLCSSNCRLLASRSVGTVGCQGLEGHQCECQGYGRVHMFEQSLAAREGNQTPCCDGVYLRGCNLRHASWP